MRKMLTILVCGLFLGSQALQAAPAAGASKATGSGSADAGHASGSGAAAGKYDPFGWSTDTFVFSLIVFGLVFLTLYKTAWPKIAKALDDREQKIRDGVEAAQKARDEAVKAQGQVEAKLREAADKVRQMLDEARRDGQRTRDDILSKAQEEIAAERERQRREVQVAIDQALQQLMGKTSDLATEIARKALRRELPQDTQRALQQDAVEALSGISSSSFGSN
jgi:F-type H+-transporting ATPase subunit b